MVDIVIYYRIGCRYCWRAIVFQIGLASRTDDIEVAVRAFLRLEKIDRPVFNPHGIEKGKLNALASKTSWRGNFIISIREIPS